MRTTILAAAILALVAILPALHGADPPERPVVAGQLEVAPGDGHGPESLFAWVAPAEPQFGIGTSPVVEPPAGEVVASLYDAIRQSRWLPAFGFGLIMLVILARRYLGKLLPWVRTKAGAFVLAFGSAAALVVGLALGAGQPLDPSLVTNACAAAWAAAGGWGHLKDLYPGLGSWVDGKEPEAGT